MFVLLLSVACAPTGPGFMQVTIEESHNLDDSYSYREAYVGCSSIVVIEDAPACETTACYWEDVPDDGGIKGLDASKKCAACRQSRAKGFATTVLLAPSVRYVVLENAQQLLRACK